MNDDSRHRGVWNEVGMKIEGVLGCTFSMFNS